MSEAETIARSRWPEPELVSRHLDDDCGCPEEIWEAFGAHLFMHLSSTGPSDAHADYGDEGEVETQITAPTIDLARAAIFNWAAILTEPAPGGGSGHVL